MKITANVSPKVVSKINPQIKANPRDPFIQKKVDKAAQILGALKEPLII